MLRRVGECAEQLQQKCCHMARGPECEACEATGKWPHAGRESGVREMKSPLRSCDDRFAFLQKASIPPPLIFSPFNSITLNWLLEATNIRIPS